MEDIQVILYIVIGAIALIGSALNKARKQQQQRSLPKKPAYNPADSYEKPPVKETYTPTVAYDQLGQPLFSYESQFMEEKLPMEDLAGDANEDHSLHTILEEVKEEVHPAFSFNAKNMREAVIYSEILKRPEY